MEFVIGAVFGAVVIALAVAVSITRDPESHIVNYMIVLAEEDNANGINVVRIKEEENA